MKTNGVSRTKANAGRMCVSVSPAWDLNTASSATSCGGPDCNGATRANKRRRTAATAMMVQSQNATRNQGGHCRSASEFVLSQLILCAVPTGTLRFLSLYDACGHVMV